MEVEWTIIISPEVANWYRGLSDADQMMVDRMLGLLRTYGNRLRMPHGRPLGEGLYELRFALQRNTIDQRITYTFEPRRRIITLTTFRKSRQNEAAEVARARRARWSQHEEES